MADERTGIDPERIALGEKIDQLRRHQRLTYAEVAARAKLDERTVRNVVAGRSTKARTVLAICDAVGLKGVGPQLDVAEFASDLHGGYCTRTTDHYCGVYEAARWSYDRSRNIVRSVFEVAWSTEARCLTFAEHQRYRDDAGRWVDFSQTGEVFSSESTGLVHLLTMWNGMLRVITLTKLVRGETSMRGVVLTQARLSFFRQPAVSPVVLRKRPEASLAAEDMATVMGEIAPRDGGYDALAADLREAERDVILSTFAMPASHERSSGLGARKGTVLGASRSQRSNGSSVHHN